VDVRIVGVNLPSQDWTDPRPGGRHYGNVHVGVQRGREVVDLHPAGAEEAVWDLTVEAVAGDGALDWRGPYVHGKRGDRFLYLSWGTLDDQGQFEMFRRAKLMLGAVDGETVDAARRPGQALVGRLSLTGGDGGPRCAAVRPPAIDWRAAAAVRR
jgi:hypothetical protein